MSTDFLILSRKGRKAVFFLFPEGAGELRSRDGEALRRAEYPEKIFPESLLKPGFFLEFVLPAFKRFFRGKGIGNRSLPPAGKSLKSIVKIRASLYDGFDFYCCGELAGQEP